MVMAKLSKLAENQTGSEIVKLGNAISERIKNGEKIYNYTIGDFDPSIFPIPQEFEDFIVQEYRQKSTSYPPADGVAELRKAVATFIKEWEGIDYAPNEIQIASGGRPLLYTIFKVLVDKGDKVIYAVPSWNNNHYVNMNEGVHCMCVTRFERITSAMEGSALSLAGDATGLERRISRANDGSAPRAASTGTPKSIRQAISPTPIARSFSMSSRHCSGVPNRPLDSK